MRLLTVRVQDFRCVDDSTEFSVADITCLVGKNESGKTAILKALHKLKPPAGSEEDFSAARDYPRRKWRPDTAIPVNPPPITTTWKLSDADKTAVEKAFGPGVLKSEVITVTDAYANNCVLSVEVDQVVLVTNSITENNVVHTDLQMLNNSASPEAAIKQLAALAAKTPVQEKTAETFNKKFPKGGMQAVIDLLWSRIPFFIYFDQYLTLPGTVSVNEIIDRQTQKQLSDRDRVFLALLSLAGTTIEKVHGSATYEEFNASLKAVSNQITEQVFKYWSQNKHLDVDMRLDQARSQDKPPFNSGWIFRTRIYNRRHRVDTSFDDRSTGFVWFFSFLVWFYQLKKTYGNNLIVLLDEPGLSLHARAQGDLLRYINEQLRPNYQVIYTTHSPFMINPDDLLSARTVEDVVVKDKKTGEEAILGTKVSEKVLSTDPDTISPLQRALDYEITQTLFVGKHTLLVEGNSDLLYLKWFSRFINPGLDYRWTICVVRGVDKIPAFVSLFRGNNLHIASVVDVGAGHKQKIENARALLAGGHLFALDGYAGQTEAEIEDVLGRDFYVALVNRCYDLRGKEQVPTAKATDAPASVAKEVSAHMAALPPTYPEFSHETPAVWLFERGDEGKNLPGFNDALARMTKLVEDINKLMPQ